MIKALLFLTLTCSMMQQSSQKLFLKEYGISLFYPKTWVLVKNDNVIFCITRPKKNANEIIIENINLTIGEAIKGLTLEETNNLTVKELQKYLPNMKVDKVENKTYNNLNYIKVIYEYSLNNLEFKVIFFQALKNGKGYNITCTCPKKTFDEYEKQFTDIMNTFEIQ